MSLSPWNLSGQLKQISQNEYVFVFVITLTSRRGRHKLCTAGLIRYFLISYFFPPEFLIIHHGDSVCSTITITTGQFPADDDTDYILSQNDLSKSSGTVKNT